MTLTPFGEFVEEVDAPGATKRIPKKASASSHSLRRLSKSSPSAHEKDEAPASSFCYRATRIRTWKMTDPESEGGNPCIAHNQTNIM